jgi:arylformamidase
MDAFEGKQPNYLDLSHPIENGMTYFPGDPQPRVNAQAGSAPWRVSELTLGSHTGTHIDAACHYFADGRTIDQYPIERFILKGLVVDCLGLDENEPIEAEKLDQALPLLPQAGALILKTGWDRYWGQKRYLRHPYLTDGAVRRLVEARVSLVGIDALNIDSTVDENSAAHEILLNEEVLIVENLARLDQLVPAHVYWFSFLPLKLVGLDGSPVRAVAWE